MIYTVGHSYSYRLYFALYGPNDVFKRGKTDEYKGGSVFKTYSGAKAYIESNSLYDYEVFGVEADWDRDTESNESEPYNTLLVDSLLVKLDDNYDKSA